VPSCWEEKRAGWVLLESYWARGGGSMKMWKEEAEEPERITSKAG